MKNLITTLFLCILIIACTKKSISEENTDDCDTKINELSQIQITALNAFQASGTAANCNNFKTAWLNAYNKLKECGRSTPDLEAAKLDIDALNCSSLSGGGGGGGGTGGGGSSTGQLTIWISSDLGYGTITVNCNNQTKYITQYYSTSTPSCGSSGCATFNITPGLYNLKASAGSASWNFSLNVVSNGCNNLRLLPPTSGGGGGSNIGHLTVYSVQNRGTITVTCGGQTRYITSYYPNQPACLAYGCATFDLPYGNYSIVGSNSNYSWNPFPISIGSPDQCYIVGLQ